MGSRGIETKSWERSKVLVMLPHESHPRVRDERSREGGDLPAPPSPHPACLPQLWVLAIFG